MNSGMTAFCRKDAFDDSDSHELAHMSHSIWSGPESSRASRPTFQVCVPLQAAPFLSALDELVKGMANCLDKRVFVGMSRGVWDCVGRAVADSLCSLEDGDAAQVLLSTPVMPCLISLAACADLLPCAMLALSTGACKKKEKNLDLRAQGAAEHGSNVLSGCLRQVPSISVPHWQVRRKAGSLLHAISTFFVSVLSAHGCQVRQPLQPVPSSMLFITFAV